MEVFISIRNKVSGPRVFVPRKELSRLHCEGCESSSASLYHTISIQDNEPVYTDKLQSTYDSHSNEFMASLNIELLGISGKRGQLTVRARSLIRYGGKHRNIVIPKNHSGVQEAFFNVI